MYTISQKYLGLGEGRGEKKEVLWGKVHDV